MSLALQEHFIFVDSSKVELEYPSLEKEIVPNSTVLNTERAP